MNQSVIVYASLSSLDVPHFLAPTIRHAAENTVDRLCTILVADSLEGPWNHVQQLLAFVYVQATSVAQARDLPLMQIDVFLQHPDDPVPESSVPADVVFRVDGDAAPLPPPLAGISEQRIPRGVSPADRKSDGDACPSLPVVALGGTFDHLHAGHKILLSMAAWITTTKLIVGVTDDALLVHKANADVIEPLAQRIAAVRSFLTAFRPGLVYDIVPINDIYGPTAWDPNIQGLVLSKETAAGGAAVAAHRAAHNLPPLEAFTIDVISATEPSLSDGDADLLKRTKMSSTAIREWIVARRKNS
ncbi:hypothetical protein FB45DRAFT_913394 [Roridomyces roridus]|uniref:Cytidyltransferase-like domain-containing protein n=1 Tax=Roridomyces roridus TaxID=1738132 RepID=A0AAD7BWQ6_9AGAR|nr:hypothetical protein FB45DRAFT_913394 [Roridomyces roridus]